MIPLYSDRKLTSFPFITIALIAANLVMFWVQLTGDGGLASSVRRYGMIPSALMSGGPNMIPGALEPALTVGSSMFLHGGFLHLASNMLYLWVFGRDIEDDFGHFGFLGFYLLSGLLATLAFAFAFPGTSIPLVGASGAIAGVLGVYFLRFPLARVRCLLIIIFYVRICEIPAFLLLGIWFFIQIGSSMSEMLSAAGAAGQGGVAWISHVAGFMVGVIWTLVLLRHRYHSRGSDSW
jgi:membrane associated rhomboid family serine protease